MTWENSNLFMAILLVIAIGIFALAAWLPLISGTFPSRNHSVALALITISQAIQSFFILGVGLSLYGIDNSRNFAMIGLPLCALGGVFALVATTSDRRGIASIISAMFTALM
jgi:hypothetical protein